MSVRKNESSHKTCSCCGSRMCPGLTRRNFIAGVGTVAGGMAAGSMAATGFAFDSQADYRPAPPRTLTVQPVLACRLYERQKQDTWRPWGGFHSEKDITAEHKRIKTELDDLNSKAQFPLEVLPLVTLKSVAEAAALAKGDHDVLIMYPANVWVDVLEAMTNPKKPTIVFVRHKSGPVYLWYEVVHNRYLRKTVDEYGQPGVDYRDVVVDKTDQLLWRLQALFGLNNTLGKKIVAVGGASGWGKGGKNAPQIARELWKLNIQTISYPALGQMINQARGNHALIKRCTQQARQYLEQSTVSLETHKAFVINAFVLTEIFKKLMAEAGTDAVTINNCMGTIMPIAETTACLPLSLLNDSGYTAYCESDFVVIPAGILLHHISQLPVFLNDPTFPHDGVVTLAHCTAPRKMDGKNYEPARILTHFESDYGAAPKVEMKLGRKITVLNPDFAGKRWLGFEGKIVDNPFLHICRSQIDVQINGPCQTLIAETRGFHWMACYGNYLREIGYALGEMNINWLNLSNTHPT